MPGMSGGVDHPTHPADEFVQRSRIGCLGVETEQRFGVGGPDVEPTVAQVDRESVEMVHERHRRRWKPRPGSLCPCRLRRGSSPPTWRTARNPAATPTGAHRPRSGRSATPACPGRAVRPIIAAEMARVLAPECRVLFRHDRLDERMAHLGTDGNSSSRPDGLGHAPRADEVVHDPSARSPG